MKIGLNLKERFLLEPLVPRGNTHELLVLSKNILDKVGVKAEDYEKFNVCNIHKNGTRVYLLSNGKNRAVDRKGKEIDDYYPEQEGKIVGKSWNEEGNKEIMYDLKAKEINIISEALKQLEKNVEYNKKQNNPERMKPELTMEHISLYEKFVLEEYPEEKETPKEDKSKENKPEEEKPKSNEGSGK